MYRTTVLGIYCISLSWYKFCSNIDNTLCLALLCPWSLSNLCQSSRYPKYPDYSEGGYPDSRILDALLPQYGSWSGPCQGEKVAERTQCTAKKFQFVYSQKRNWYDLNPNFHIHVSVSDLYIPTIGPPIFLQQIREYINRSQNHGCMNWDCSRAVPFLGIFVSNFRYCVFALCSAL